MRLTYKQKLVQILRICDEYHGKSRSRIWLKNKLREAIASLDSFNSMEKAELYRTAFDTAVNTVTVPATAGGRSTPDFSDSKNCKDLVQVMGKLERHTDSRDKAKRIKDTIARSRSNVTDDPGKLPIIFYACSRHSSPANDHKDYQGAIYVDRYWRRYTVGMMPEWITAAVEDYIEKNEVVSIQKIMGPPVWLGVRSYCRHIFTPVKTLTVLTENKNTYIKKTYARRTKRGATYEYIKKHLK